MSKIYDSLKKSDDTISSSAAGNPEGKGMDINDMKKQILERLREKREAAASITETEKPAIDLSEALKAIKKSDEPAAPQERVVIKQDEELLRQYNSLKAELEQKNAAIQGLSQKLEAAGQAAASQEEALKIKDKKTAEVVRLMRELEAARKSSSDYQSRLESLQSENRKSFAERDEAAKLLKRLRSDIETKEKIVQDLERRLKEEKDRSASTAEILKTRDKRLADADRLSRDLEGAKKFGEEHRTRLENLQGEHRKVTEDRDEAAKLLKRLRSDIETKEKTIQDLQRRTARINELEDALRARDKRITDADRLAKDLEASKILSEENRMKFENAQAEIRRITAMHDEAAGHHGKLKDELGKKDTFVLDLQKKYASDLDELTRDRDKAAANVESLRSKLYVATKEAKEHLAKITQLEEASRIKEKKVLEAEKLSAELTTAKHELESKLLAAENANKISDDKIFKRSEEFALQSSRFEQMDKTCKDLESANNALNLQLQTGLRDKKDLEAKIGQMHLELTSKTNRLGETDKLYKELESAVNDLTASLQDSQRDKKALEASHGDITLQLQNTQRDKKNLETRISQLSSELEAKTIRLEEKDKLHNETEELVKDATIKRQESHRRAEEVQKELSSVAESLKNALQKMKEAESVAKDEIGRLTAEQATFKNVLREQAKKELDFRNSIEHLEGEIQTRDSKIEGDIKYTDKLVKEVSELRKKLAMLERQTRG